MHDQPTPSLLSSFNVPTGGQVGPASAGERPEHDPTRMLRDILSALDRHNELLEEMVSQFGAAQRQRNQEMANWKAANPELAADCRRAAENLSRVQTAFLESLTNEINTNYDQLADGEFMLNEFVDRFGPRLAHLSGVLQVLAQLSGPTQ